MTDHGRVDLGNSVRPALVIHALHGGGAERLMSQLAARWSAMGCDVHLITLDTVQSDRYTVPSNLKRHGLGLMKVSRSPFHALLATRRRIAALKRVLQQVQPSFVLSFCDRTNILCLAASKSLSCPRWIAEHSDPRRQLLPAPWRWARQRYYHSATGAVALTPEIAKWMREQFGISDVRVIPPAIEPRSAVEPAGLTPHAEYGKSDPAGIQPLPASGSEQLRNKTVLAVGRLSTEKNFSLLIEAWRDCASKLPDWTLEIAGDGPERERLESNGHDLLESGRLRFLGWVEQPRPLMAQCGFFVLTSHYEGFPVALLEAMSEGAACLSVRCCDAVQTLAKASPWY
ncbi:MAG: glycosyltransferase [Pirellulales bacterium]